MTRPGFHLAGRRRRAGQPVAKVVPDTPPIVSFVPSREQVERLTVSGTKRSAIAGAVREHRIEQLPPFGQILLFVEKMGAFREF